MRAGDQAAEQLSAPRFHSAMRAQLPHRRRGDAHSRPLLCRIAGMQRARRSLRGAVELRSRALA
eukprot:10636240-Prorocentrum_lima.AAC.1